MIYKIDDYSKVEKLFNNWPYPDWYTVMNLKVEIYADDPESPKSAIGFLGTWCYCVGEPNKALITRKRKDWFGLFPQNRKWEKLIKECYPEASMFTRYAIKHDAVFDKEKLQAMIEALPEQYELKKIDSKVYDLCKKVTDDDLEELTDWFRSKRQFMEMGLGYAVIKDGKVVGGASTAFRFPKGIDIEIDVDEYEIEHLNNYTVETSKVTGKSTSKLRSTGLQLLDGVQATSYCRIRYTAGDDFKRTERQREVLEAIANKAKTLSVADLDSIVKAAL